MWFRGAPQLARGRGYNPRGTPSWASCSAPHTFRRCVVPLSSGSSSSLCLHHVCFLHRSHCAAGLSWTKMEARAVAAVAAVGCRRCSRQPRRGSRRRRSARCLWTCLGAARSCRLRTCGGCRGVGVGWAGQGQVLRRWAGNACGACGYCRGVAMAHTAAQQAHAPPPFHHRMPLGKTLCGKAPECMPQSRPAGVLPACKPPLAHCRWSTVTCLLQYDKHVPPSRPQGPHLLRHAVPHGARPRAAHGAATNLRAHVRQPAQHLQGGSQGGQTAVPHNFGQCTTMCIVQLNSFLNH